MDKVHDIDSNGFQSFSGVLDTKGYNIMHHQNSVFHGLLKHIPCGVFDDLVKQHKTDKYTRKLPTQSQFVAILFGQLGGAVSLREIENGLQSHKTKLNHLGAKPIARSTLADANLSRSHEVFSQLLGVMMCHANRGLRKASKDLIRLIDSTSISLPGAASQWATYSKSLFMIF